ncbi:MAG: 4-amino-4-deoxy-L-arabinose-phosphoundecaprenol flippase subunit ArnE [Methanoregula sp. PtaU1.Bin006]|nr:MAG: 4-amino-4-deoxy-L-arabinose-phosphoundecaprenol flippase subunit ArnE [Methanoregula sp. PtaB.Bin085]OPY32045.1 MAG: 4-amino-4-deoxy-L-arabinose-phosphoundecaprenol flippase subunit ArnE [Methanoregula sp. PtaU1.Bin006]
MSRNFYIIFIILSILFQAFSGIFGKYAALSLIPSGPLAIFSNSFYLLSIGCMILQAIVWQVALTQYDISLVYPFQSITMIVVLFLSFQLFGETISVFNITGIAIIFMGIYFLSREIPGGIKQ